MAPRFPTEPSSQISAGPQNGRQVKRFNRTYREEVLNCYLFETLGEVRQMTAEWIARYNERRPHEALGNLTPRQYLIARYPQLSTFGRSE
jgi:putative transposase